MPDHRLLLTGDQVCISLNVLFSLAFYHHPSLIIIVIVSIVFIVIIITIVIVVVLPSPCTAFSQSFSVNSLG